MKVLVSTHPIDPRGDDFCFVPDGEIVYQNPLTCDNGALCGCEVSLVGIDTHRSTTTAVVTERDVDLEEIANTGQWPLGIMIESLRAAAEAAEQYPVGTVVRVARQDFRWVYLPEYLAGDQVKILVGGPHENQGRTATVGRVQEDGEVVIYFGDQDEDEWVYSPNELAKLT